MPKMLRIDVDPKHVAIRVDTMLVSDEALENVTLDFNDGGEWPYYYRVKGIEVLKLLLLGWVALGHHQMGQLGWGIERRIALLQNSEEE